MGNGKPRKRFTIKPPSAMAAFADDLREDYERVFEEEEADDRREELIEKLIGWSGDLDEFFTISNREQVICDIWQLDEDEARPLANAWLRRARRDKRAAAALRLAMSGDDYFRSVMILGPRMLRSAQWYPQHGGFALAPWNARSGNTGEEGPQ